MNRLPRFLKRARQGLESMSIAKQLPSGCAIRRANGADVAHVASLLRPADRAEMQALEGRPAVDILTAAIDAPGLGQARKLTIHDRAAVLYGIVPCEDQPCSAKPWLATTDRLADGEATDLMWLSRVQVDAWQHRRPPLRSLPAHGAPMNTDTRRSYR